MRDESRAICTSQEPVSFSCVRLASIICGFSGILVELRLDLKGLRFKDRITSTSPVTPFKPHAGQTEELP